MVRYQIEIVDWSFVIGHLPLKFLHSVGGGFSDIRVNTKL
ncbi:hypothetical protein MC7420_5660 [Coleofasciculus chthonoplastes PCC 7420]|uniref:Uncharacterized protein n=1 Tax=Coleofasciculus chthonoplastes PCC 7420 TaxID=118168 RepID=B4VPB0_9CYAN|nr:hypothetical protein MC7420_5660 [Coleofasciculus chthonoplastes PCC 7420]